MSQGSCSSTDFACFDLPLFIFLHCIIKTHYFVRYYGKQIHELSGEVM
jgi:hypothetical protein